MQLAAGWSVHTCTPGPRLAADHERRVAHVPEPAHAQLGEREPRREPAGRVDPGVDHAGAAAERVDGDAQLGGALRHAVGQRRGAGVHPEVGGGGAARAGSVMARPRG
jgi:hypothetical protein